MLIFVFTLNKHKTGHIKFYLIFLYKNIIFIFLDKRKKVTFSKKVDIQLIPCEEVSPLKTIFLQLKKLK